MYYNLNLSDGASKAITKAGEAALRFGSEQIGTEHLLFGISCIKSAASDLLDELGITNQKLEGVLRQNYVEQNLTSHITLTPSTKNVLRIAGEIAKELGYNYIGTEHMLWALMSSTNCYACKIVNAYFNISPAIIQNELLEMMQTRKAQAVQDHDQPGDSQQDAAAQEKTGKSPLSQKLLDMGYDVTAKAKDGKIEPIIGREGEIERVIEILCRKNKNNPVLIGEAGVGKTSVVEGLALAIARGNVPEELKDKIVFSLEIGSLVSGTKYRGAMEEKLKDAINIITADKRIIVFIDELHTLAQAGAEKGEVSPSDMLKPYLARGEIHTIGATTTEEYRKYIEKDKALERRFQPVVVNPPTPEQTIEILQGLRDSFEAFHKVTITDDAISSAVNLSERYIVDRNLPDKAIDLIDQACSRVKLNFSAKPLAILEKEEKIKQLSANRDEASFQREYEQAAKYQSEIIKLETELNELSLKNANKARDNNCITAQDIASIVSNWTGIPVAKLTETEKDKLVHLEEILHKRVIGQDEAVAAVAKAIRRSRVGIADAKRPIGSFLFLGQTGVGKTELCKAIAEALFDDEKNIIRLDMSEFMEQHSVSKLIGAPPGYVGYDEGGQLTEQVRKKPYSVVLFDEIEKAHPDVFNTLLQVLDDGRLTDSQGRTVNFRNTIIIMTSNLGASEVKNQSQLGFAREDVQNDVKKIYMDCIKKKFRPEFLNRIDVVTIFKTLSHQDLVKISTLIITNLTKRLAASGLELKITVDAIEHIASCADDGEYGARPIKRYIQQNKFFWVSLKKKEKS